MEDPELTALRAWHLSINPEVSEEYVLSDYARKQAQTKMLQKRQARMNARCRALAKKQQASGELKGKRVIFMTEQGRILQTHTLK